MNLGYLYENYDGPQCFRIQIEGKNPYLTLDGILRIIAHFQRLRQTRAGEQQSQ